MHEVPGCPVRWRTAFLSCFSLVPCPALGGICGEMFGLKSGSLSGIRQKASTAMADSGAGIDGSEGLGASGEEARDSLITHWSSVIRHWSFLPKGLGGLHFLVQPLQETIVTHVRRLGNVQALRE